MRAGHIVWGQTRSQATADTFGAHEVLPVVCDPHTPEGQKVWSAIAKDVDVGELRCGFGQKSKINSQSSIASLQPAQDPRSRSSTRARTRSPTAPRAHPARRMCIAAGTTSWRAGMVGSRPGPMRGSPPARLATRELSGARRSRLLC